MLYLGLGEYFAYIVFSLLYLLKNNLNLNIGGPFLS